MSKPYTITAKVILGAALLVFCGVLMSSAADLDFFTKNTAASILEWSVIIIVIIIIGIMPMARRLDNARKSDTSKCSPLTVSVRNGTRLLRGGAVLIALSVVLFFCIPSLDGGFSRDMWQFLNFIDTGLFSVGAIYLVAGFQAKKKRG